jgi:CBS domain-containing protein
MKTVKDIMTPDPACCGPETPLAEVARLMVENDCGCIPVVERHSPAMAVGVVTDRDITTRTVAAGVNPLEMTARDVMSGPARTVTPETSVDDCLQVMETHMIRRVPVVDEDGCVCGIVAQADIALHTAKQKAAELVREVSQPKESASHPAVA